MANISVPEGHSTNAQSHGGSAHGGFKLPSGFDWTSFLMGNAFKMGKLI